MSEHVGLVTDATFQEAVYESPLPVLVDFWAEWCGPCRAMAPILEAVAAEAGGKFRVLKLNVDDNPRTPPDFGIRGIPTMILFKAGKVAGMQVGALPKAELEAFLRQHVAGL